MTDTLTVLASVLTISTDDLLGITPPINTTERDRSLAQIEAALPQISDSDLKLIPVEVRAVAAWKREDERG